MLRCGVFSCGLDAALGLPSVDLVLSQTLDVFFTVDGLGAAVDVDEVLAVLGQIQALLIAGGIAEGAVGVLADQLSGLGVVLHFTNNLFHGNISFRIAVQKGRTPFPKSV